MIREKIVNTLAMHGPQTIDDLSGRLGIPRALLRSALTTEIYRQTEVDHPEYGRTTAWALRPSAVRLDNRDRYCVCVHCVGDVDD